MAEFIMVVTPIRRLSDEHWEEIKGSPQHARMALNRLHVSARHAATDASASVGMFAEMVERWLGKHATAPYYINTKTGRWHEADISFWDKNDMFAFKLYYDGIKVNEDRHILKEIV
ncbi:MAG: hypothetical protein EOP83_12710 [Verrucomicrobiaceae bacterium]|nr:MAG: hypothetical protein EOP83_12710 [Verrucomicrobiaceae bacterium]